MVCGWELEEFAARFALDDAVYVCVAFVVPDTLGGEIHGEGVGGFFPVVEGVGAVVSAAADAAADQTCPKVKVGLADAAFGGVFVFAGELAGFAEFVLRVAADGAAAAFPLLKTCAVENVLADNC